MCLLFMFLFFVSTCLVRLGSLLSRFDEARAAGKVRVPESSAAVSAPKVSSIVRVFSFCCSLGTC